MPVFKMYIKQKFLSGAVAALFCLCLVAPAQAGFKLVPPDAQNNASSGRLPQPLPLAGSQNNLPPVMSSPSMAVVPQPLTAPALSASGVASDGAILEGFANRIPLGAMLRQVVPPDHGFSVAESVDLGTLVSWRGGQSWQNVLQQSLSSVGLSASFATGMVNIARAGEAFVPPRAAATSYDQLSATGPDATPMTLTPKATMGGSTSGILGVLPAYENNPMPISGTDALNGAAVIEGDAAPLLIEGENAALSSPTTIEGDSSTALYVWRAERGDTLKSVLQNWSDKAGVELSWDAEYDYPLQATSAYTGSYEDALRQMLAGLADAEPQPMGRLHKNSTAGQAVLVITTRGNQYGR